MATAIPAREGMLALQEAGGVLDVLTLGMNPWGVFVLSGGIFRVSKLTSLDVN